MTLDKIWTKITNKVDPTFIRGALAFAERGERYIDSEGQIHCPCRKCVNARRHVPRVVSTHFIHNGFKPSYNVWIYHSEHLPGYETDGTNSECEESENESNDGVHELLDDAFPNGGETEAENLRDSSDPRNNPHVDKLFDDMVKPLYPGCDEFYVLGFLLELMNVKVTCKMTNISMDMILNLFSQAFKDANLPKNHHEAKNYLRTLGLGYESIHACKHDCALFWKENAELENCPVCSTSRYEENGTGKKKPVKILRYFPITSRLKRLYASRHTTKEMTWHDRRTKEEGVLRHPTDGKAWTHFDAIFPDFANDPRNVRLGVASDGFNHFGAKSVSYCMWPVVLIPYNMPPWKSMVDASFMLTLLIQEKIHQERILMYFLRPLVDELKLLWDKGVETYDCESKQRFNMCATLLWTINDFPSYGYLSGWSTSGYKACPICNEDASSIRIRDRIAYVGHRRFLPQYHSSRKAPDFNGQKETRHAPKPVNGEECLRQLKHLTIHHHGKCHNLRPHPGGRSRDQSSCTGVY